MSINDSCRSLNESKRSDKMAGEIAHSGVQLWDRLRGSTKATGTKLLPRFMVEEVQRYRALTASELPLYLKLRMMNGLGLANEKSSLPMAKARSILFVCFGNIMRSPMCEALMRRQLATASQSQISVASAGLNAVPGRTAHPWAIAAARDFGIGLEGHRASLLTPEMVDQADVIFGMDYQNQAQLWSRYPQARNKCVLLGGYGGIDRRSGEIRDPYYGGAAETRQCYRILDGCIQNLMRSLSDR